MHYTFYPLSYLESLIIDVVEKINKILRSTEYSWFIRLSLILGEVIIISWLLLLKADSWDNSFALHKCSVMRFYIVRKKNVYKLVKLSFVPNDWHTPLTKLWVNIRNIIAYNCIFLWNRHYYLFVSFKQSTWYKSRVTFQNWYFANTMLTTI